MQIEREKKYRIDNFDKSVLDTLNTQPLHFNQYYLEMSDFVLAAIKYYHGPIAQNMAKEARVRVIDTGRGTSTCMFTVKSGGNLARSESEVMIPDGVAENLINNYAVGMIEKVRYVYRTGLHIVEINNFLDRDLVLAEIEYEDDIFTEQDIDEEMIDVIGKLDSNAKVVDVTYDESYKNKNMALPFEKQEVEEYDDEDDDEEVNE